MNAREDSEGEGVPSVEDGTARLAALRAAGAARHDPLRIAYLDALVRRTTGQPAAVRALLEAKFAGTLAECAQHFATTRQAAHAAPGRGGSPLTELLRHIERHARDDDELKAVRNFHDTWAQLSVARQLSHAIERAPENAGPLNSHHLVLRSLERMRDLSPAYLKRFLAYADTLLLLEQATVGAAPKKPARVRTAKR
ncbi:DUF2894 domain-containing protein [Rhodocyclaceae bacterium]